MAGTDALLDRARAGDREALGILWREHRRWIAAVLLAHRPREADLDDLLQDVATKMVEQFATLRDPRRLRPWLRAIAVNTARSAGRSAQARHSTLSLDDAHDELAESAPVVNLDATLDSGGILDRVRALPADYREALLLQAVRGFSQREIAEALDVPETTVETRLARARRMLRAQNLDPRKAHHDNP